MPVHCPSKFKICMSCFWHILIHEAMNKREWSKNKCGKPLKTNRKDYLQHNKTNVRVIFPRLVQLL